MESQLGKHFMETLRNILTLSDPPPIAPSPAGLEPSETSPPRASRTGLVPGHFHSSEFLIELKIQDVVHTGYPKVCLVDRSTGTERWGSPLDWSWPNPNQRRVAWVDNEQRGLTQRTLARAEDALGAEGSLGDLHFRFERILELGRNQVVYALYCPEKNRRLAYGSNRTLFEPTYQRPR